MHVQLLLTLTIWAPHVDLLIAVMTYQVHSAFPAKLLHFQLHTKRLPGLRRRSNLAFQCCKDSSKRCIEA